MSLRGDAETIALVAWIDGDTAVEIYPAPTSWFNLRREGVDLSVREGRATHDGYLVQRPWEEDQRAEEALAGPRPPGAAKPPGWVRLRLEADRLRLERPLHGDAVILSRRPPLVTYADPDGGAHQLV